MAKRKETPSDAGWLKAVAAGSGSLALWLLHAAPLLILIGGAVYGSVRLWQVSLRDQAFVVAGDTVSLSGAVRFCPESVAEVERLGRIAAGRSLLDPLLISDLRRQYARSPWIKRVDGFRRVFPNRLAVEFVVRVPAAQVRQSGYYWLIDRDGLLLPVPGRPSPLPDLPEIAGTSGDAVGPRPNAPGKVWSDVGIHDALALLRELDASPLSEDLHVRRVLVHGGSFLNRLQQRVRNRPRLDLETREGVIVRWGTYNDGDDPDDILSSEKLAMLRSLVARDFASIPGVSLDVRTRVPGFTLPDREP